MIVAIHQPNYLPWLGYFHKIARADVFVFLDDVQFSKGSYTNRVRILRDGRAAWLTQPVRHGLGQPINAVGFAQPDWPQRHRDGLRGAYGRAACFRQLWSEIAALYDDLPAAGLAAVNQVLIERIAGRLGLDCEFRLSSALGHGAQSGDARLAALVAEIAPSGTYLSGAGGANYQSEATFTAAGLTLAYGDYTPPRYDQGGGDFLAGLSIVDAVFALGWESTRTLLAGA